MPFIAIAFGILLVGLGAWGFFQTSSPTALIPAFWGVGLLLLGLLGLYPPLRKHAMHVAAALGLIGCIVPGVMGVPKLATMISGGEVAHPKAAIAQSIMALLCAIFVGLCVQSFVAARRRRKSGPPNTQV